MGPPAEPIQPIAISVKEAIRISGFGKSLFWQLIQRGEIPTLKIGRRRLVLLAPYRAWLLAKAV